MSHIDTLKDRLLLDISAYKAQLMTAASLLRKGKEQSDDQRSQRSEDCDFEKQREASVGITEKQGLSKDEPDLIKIYSFDESTFANTFYDLIPQIDPKVVRLIAYQLFTKGVTLGDLYKQRQDTAVERGLSERGGDTDLPKFLYNLSKVTSETILVLLKYGFPSVVSELDQKNKSETGGNLFFWWSLDQPGDWIDFVLDLCIHLKIDLNMLNRDTGETILHNAVKQGYLPLVQKILQRKVDPNRKSKDGVTPLTTLLLLDSQIVIESPISYQIIRELHRYGATLSYDDQKIISCKYRAIFDDRGTLPSTNWKVNKDTANLDLLNVYSKMPQIKPIYASDRETYWKLDTIEELTLIAEVKPSVITTDDYQSMLNIKDVGPIFVEAIDRERSKIYSGPVKNTNSVKPLIWPYYINSSDRGLHPVQYGLRPMSDRNKVKCALNVDDRIVVDLPPSPEAVYDRFHADIPEPTFGKDWTDTTTPSSFTPSPFGSPFNAITPTEFASTVYTIPLASGPLLATPDPRLPSL